MPEWAEVKLMGEFAGASLIGNRVISIVKNPINKQQLGLTENMLLPANVNVIHQGKENIFQFRYFELGHVEWEMKLNYGMSGHWGIYPVRFGHKHSMLSFELEDESFLEFVDPRRFGRWKFGKTVEWGNKGCDPMNHNFHANIFRDLNHKGLQRPLCEVLLDQRWFNGVGNYLRAEILYHWGLNPFLQIRDLQISDITDLLDRVRLCLNLSYQYGGASLYTWKNPGDRPNDKSLKDILVCYKKGEWCIDGTGRRFWYNPKFREDCPFTKTSINKKKKDEAK